MPDSASRDDPELRHQHHHQHHHRHTGHGTGTTTTMLPDRYEPFKRLAMIQVHPPPNPNKPLTPFSITDILNGRTRRPERRNGDAGPGTGGAISALSPGSLHFPATSSRLFRSHVIRTRTPAPDAKAFLRPWDDVTSPSNSTSDDNDEEIDIEEEKPPQGKSVSPLDALFQMTSKTFDGRTADGSLQPDGSRREQLNLFAKAQPAKKRRKSRTAFTNQQIYELEKRFLYQKYLTPADRDEIAQNLGLTNAQVITWFQNRRAKLKRDLEELKADVTAAKHLSDDDSVLPGVAQIDEIQLFNKHGLKRVEKKSSQAVSGVSTTISSTSNTTSSSTRTTTSTASGTPTEGATIPSARQSERTLSPDGRRSVAHAQSPTVGACASALGSPDSTTHPTEGALSSAPDMDRPNDPDCDTRRGQPEPEVEEADDDDDDDDDEEIDV